MSVKILKSHHDWWCFVRVGRLTVAFGRPCYNPRWYNVWGINVALGLKQG